MIAIRNGLKPHCVSMDGHAFAYEQLDAWQEGITASLNWD